MRINVDGPASSDNFDTEKFVSDWIESTVTSKQLNGYNLSRTETHAEADENVIVFRAPKCMSRAPKPVYRSSKRPE